MTDVGIRRARVLVPQTLVQLSWLTFAGIAVSLLVAGIGPYAVLATVACEGTGCLAAQFSPAQALSAERAGLALTPQDGLQMTAMALFPAVISLLTAGYCIWRRSGDLPAVAGAWGLTALGTGEFVRALAQHDAGMHIPADLVQLVALVGLFLCFGHMLGQWRRSAWVAWSAVGTALLGALAFFGDAGLDVQIALGTGWFGLLAASLAQQLRAATDSQGRERVTWAIVSLALFLGAQLVGGPPRLLPLPAALPSSLPLQAFTLITINGMVLSIGAVACLAVALLRGELFDAELVLNRALVYALLSIVVVASYALIVGYLSLVFQSSGNLWLSLVATGVVAALFQPVRERLQRVVNQLLYGQRAEPYAVVAELARQVGSLPAPEAMLPTLVESVAGALRLPYAAIVLRQGESEVVTAAHGQAPSGGVLASFPLVYQGTEIGRLRVAPRSGEAELDAEDRRLLADLARQIGVAAHVVQLTGDLKRSREQLVSTREEERRRLRRDLHDGLGPALASQALSIDTVELLLSRDPAAAAALLREVKTQTQSAIAEIRRVVYDLRPPALDDLGLAGALRELAVRLIGTAVEVSVVAPSQLPPLPAAAEVAIYRIAQEALANVAHHSCAKRCTVALVVGDALTLTVSDDGRGIPAGRTAGVGLTSMRERAEELGGSLEVSTGSDVGTTVHAILPLGHGRGERGGAGGEG